MRKATFRSLAIAGGVALVGTLAMVPASAAPSDEPVLHQAAESSAEQRRVIDYWTPERMRDAQPVTGSILGADRGPIQLPEAAAQSDEIEPQANPERAQPRHGKVFFTQNGRGYVCSGTSTTSQNKSIVTTAGHCVSGGAGAPYHTNWVFVPAYDNGSAPYGKWPARSLVATPEWQNQGVYGDDVAFAVMNKLSNRNLTDVVGGFPVRFNQARGLTYKAFGYPAASPFDGEKLYSVTGKANRNTYTNDDSQWITNDMTGGSSGGGWITNNGINGVNSYKYPPAGWDKMFSPYFGATEQRTFNRAAAA